jgi:hypothetical protein
VNRPNQIRRVYIELRRALGDDLSAGDLLRLAASIVRAYRAPEEADPTSNRPPFFALEVDKAMKDGGWRVLHHEERTGTQLSEELPDNYFNVQAKIRELVGQTQ